MLIVTYETHNLERQDILNFSTVNCSATKHAVFESPENILSPILQYALFYILEML